MKIKYIVVQTSWGSYNGQTEFDTVEDAIAFHKRKTEELQNLEVLRKNLGNPYIYDDGGTGYEITIEYEET